MILGCHYEEAHAQAELLLDDATEYRVDLALSHAQAMLGYSLAGLRDSRGAQQHFDAPMRLLEA